MIRKLINRSHRSFVQISNPQLVFFQYKRPLSHDQYSGFTATIFGCTGFMGLYIGKVLGNMGADLVFPHSAIDPFSDKVRWLKLCAPIKRAILHYNMDYNDQDLIQRMIKHSDVVINLLKPRMGLKHYNDYQLVNIKYAKRIALACSKNTRVKRLIHFSACAENPHSQSFDFKSKHFGQNQVKSIYPQATILKPSLIYGIQDNSVCKFLNQQHKFFGNNVVFSDLNSKKQPIEARDVAQAVKNILYLENTKGQTYYLGGPHVHTLRQTYQIALNQFQQNPKVLSFPHQLAKKLSLNKWFIPWKYFNYQDIVKQKIDQVVPEGVKTIADLMIRPASFKQGVGEIQEQRQQVTDGIKDSYIIS